MTEREMLERDIATLRDSIKLNWIDLDRLELSPEDRSGIRENIRVCLNDLQQLLERLDHAD